MDLLLEEKKGMIVQQNDIQIVSYEKQQHQLDIELLLETIGDEFSEPISVGNTNKTPLPADLYLVAVCESRVIGTISITRLENGNAVLRKMFLHKNYRGQGIAKLLLQSIVHWCVDNNVNAIYLGTMTQFERAQKFYENHNFERIDVDYLPIDFPVNPIDSIFYKLELDYLKQ